MGAIPLSFVIRERPEDADVEVEIGRRCGRGGFDVYDRIPVEDPPRDGRVELEWDPAQILDETPELVDPKDYAQDREPGLRFRVRVAGDPYPPGPHLPIHTRLELAFVDAEGRPLEHVARVRVDCGGQAQEAEVNADGIWQLQTKLPAELQVHAQDRDGLPIEFFRINDTECRPGVERGKVIRKPGACDNRLTFHCLPPPCVINLRDEAQQLDPARLEYFKRLGNATVFIHGFNVEEGRLGRWLKGFVPDRQRRGTVTMYRPEEDAEVPAPGVFRDREALGEAFNRRPDRLLVDEAEALNGHGAWSWFQCMEYQLNRAAGGGSVDWENYTRLIGVTWAGDTGSTDYIPAIIESNLAARRIQPLLDQLDEAGIQTNVIAHSLGCRLALAALHLRHAPGGHGSHGRLENVFLWQPALATNALDPGELQDSPVGVFNQDYLPHAHEGARRFIVLYSEGDQVLGPRSENNGVLANFLRGNITETGGALPGIGGIYPSKAAMGSLRQYLYEMLEEFLGSPLARGMDQAYANNDRRSVAPRERDKRLIKERLHRIEEGFEQLHRYLLTALEHHADAPEKEWRLLPIAHHPRPTREHVDALHQRLWTLYENNNSLDYTPEAMGYAGPKWVSDRGERLESEGPVDKVDTTAVLNGHSEMRMPSEELFQATYRVAIMEGVIMRSTGWGRQKS